MATEKNATYRKFIYDLKADCAADLLALSLKSHIDELESVCTSVESSMDNRQFNIGLRNADLSVAEARNAVDTHFQTLVTVLAAALTIKPTPVNLEFAAKFNGLASLYRNTLKARTSARLSAKEAKEEELVQDSDTESGQEEASGTL